MKHGLLALGAGLIFLAGIALQPRIANSTPAVEATAGGDGSLPAVALRIVDERTAPSPRGEGAAPGMELVPELIRKQVVAYLGRKGFVVTDYGDSAPRSLSIEIRSFEYERLRGGVAIGVRSDFRALAVAEGRTYEREYWAKVVHHAYVLPSRSNNEEWVRLGLGDVMPQFTRDTRLSGLLAGH